MVRRLSAIVGNEQVADLLETADYPAPEGWDDALGYAVSALKQLPRSKVSVSPGRVSITAISDSADAKQKLETDLTRAAPPGLRMTLDIAAPRPVLTPFTLRFLIDENGARFDACSADTDAAKSRILAAAVSAGLTGSSLCTVGMGVPTPKWADASVVAIRALAEIGQGSVTFSDADVSLVAAEGTEPALFDRVIGELETALPDVFALHAVLPVTEDTKDAGPSEFVATLSPEGLVQLRGRISDENLRHMADSYAKSRFGSDKVYIAARIIPDLPIDWPVRVLTGLEALSLLENGVVVVTQDNMTVRGISERETANADIAQLLSAKLGQTNTYDLDITFRPPPVEPEVIVPTADSCQEKLAMAQNDSKLLFDPGRASLAAGSLNTMNAIAEILNDCGEIPLEIQGHTDSQGRESMNQQLSQARAQTVLNELRARRVLTGTYVATGYGEAIPIADNGTEEGREANRRIEFHLIRMDGSDGSEDTDETADLEGAGDPATGTDGATDADSTDTTTDPDAPAADTPDAPETEPDTDSEAPTNEQN